MSATVQSLRPHFPAAHLMVPAAQQPAGAAENPLARLDQAAMAVTIAADTELFDQDSPARSCYQITSGCLRTVRLMEDGRRLIDRFLLPGDLLGFDAGTHHDVSAQAVAPTSLRRYPLLAVTALAARDADFARFLWHTTTAMLRDAHAHGLLLGRKTAIERVASFLYDMAARLPDHHAGDLTLPMGRTDIADHLGLTVETISRTLTQLRSQGVIIVQPGAVGIRDATALAELAGVADLPRGGPRRLGQHVPEWTH